MRAKLQLNKANTSDTKAPCLDLHLSNVDGFVSTNLKKKKTEFSDRFKKIITRYKRIGYNVDVMRYSACLVVNPITVNKFAVLFNCTPMGRGSDSMIAPT